MDTRRNLVNWRKPTFWVILLAAIACIALAACLLTNPDSSPSAADIDSPEDGSPHSTTSDTATEEELRAYYARNELGMLSNEIVLYGGAFREGTKCVVPLTDLNASAMSDEQYLKNAIFSEFLLAVQGKPIGVQELKIRLLAYLGAAFLEEGAKPR